MPSALQIAAHWPSLPEAMIILPSRVWKSPEGAAIGLSLPTRGACWPVRNKAADSGETMAVAQSIMAMSMCSPTPVVMRLNSAPTMDSAAYRPVTWSVSGTAVRMGSPPGWSSPRPQVLIRPVRPWIT